MASIERASAKASVFVLCCGGGGGGLCKGSALQFVGQCLVILSRRVSVAAGSITRGQQEAALCVGVLQARVALSCPVPCCLRWLHCCAVPSVERPWCSISCLCNVICDLGSLEVDLEVRQAGREV